MSEPVVPVVVEVSRDEYHSDPRAYAELANENTQVLVLDDDGRVIVQLGGSPHNEETPQMRRFFLNRKRDVTGVSGTGIVAEGVVFSDGTVALRWRGDHSTTVMHANILSVEHIHLHHGSTSIQWIDE